MQQIAKIKFPIHYLLRRRWSPRAFSDEMIEPEKLQSLFEAVRWAPSSYNEQPWYFIVATRENDDAYKRLLDCLAEGNIRWAQNAPILMLSVAKRRFERNDKENRHALHDVGMAVENLIIQAISLNIYVHQMAGFDKEKAHELFEISEGYEPVAAMALGYLGNPEMLPEKLAEKETDARDRKRVRDFVFDGCWGKQASFVPEKE